MFKFKQFFAFSRIALQYFFTPFFLKVPTGVYEAVIEIIFVTIWKNLPEMLDQLKFATYLFYCQNKQQYRIYSASCCDDRLQNWHCNAKKYNSNNPQQNQK